MKIYSKFLIGALISASSLSFSFSGEKILWQSDLGPKSALLNKVLSSDKNTGYAEVLPICEVNGKNYALLGQEYSKHQQKRTFCGFGGKVDKNEKVGSAALREFYEETSGVYNFTANPGDFEKKARICYNDTNNVMTAFLDVDYKAKKVFTDALAVQLQKPNNAHFHEKMDFIWVDLKSLSDSVKYVKNGAENPSISVKVLNDDGTLSKQNISLRGKDFFAKTLKNSEGIIKKYLAPKKVLPVAPVVVKPVAPAPVKPVAVNKDLLQLDAKNTAPKAWTAGISKMVNYHFSKPYKDKPAHTTKNIGGKDYTVNRPNHALAHGLRQGLLAADIVEALNTISTSHSIQFASSEANEFMKWVSDKVKSDPYFIQKVEFASAFQRTGRQSEASSSKNLALYNSYERADAKNFDYYAKKHMIGQGSLFKDNAEAQVYKEAILWSTANEGKIDVSTNKDLYFLRKILHAAHSLDLRRMTKFDLKRMKCSVVGELFGLNLVDQAAWTINPAFKGEEEFVNRLWRRSGEYLLATGDKEIESNKKYYSDQFYTLAHDHKKMSDVLQNAKQSSAVKF